MDKSLETLAFLGRFQFTQVQPLPSPHKQCWTRVSRIFFRVSTLYRVGGGRTARKFRKGCTVLRGNREMTEKFEYCSTVPKTFVQDCLNPGFGKKVCFLHFSYPFWAFWRQVGYYMQEEWPLKLFCRQGNSQICHIGPIPLNWSRVQRKLVMHDLPCIAHSTRSQKHSVLSIFATN